MFAPKPLLNLALHNLGGDCCEATCQSSELYSCGVLELGSGIDNLEIGFPFCKDPRLNCLPGEICWTPKSANIPLLIKRSTGTFAKLAANGRTIIVSEYELDTIRVFDQVDSRWVQRGQTLEGQARSKFGTHVAISALPGTVVRRRLGKTPIVVAVASTGNTINAVDVFSFEPFATSWQRLGRALSFNETIDSLSIGNSGVNIRLAVGLRESNNCLIYQLTTEAQALGHDFSLYWRTKGSIVALSGDGEIMTGVSVLPFHGMVSHEIHNVSSVDEELENFNPIGNVKFAFATRPVGIQGDYFGTNGAIMGEVAQGIFGFKSVTFLSLKRPSSNSYDIIVDRSIVFDEIQNVSRSDFVLSTDTFAVAVNYGGERIVVYDTAVAGRVNGGVASQTRPFPVDDLESKVTLSDGGKAMAVVMKDHVSILQRNLACEGIILRLAITLDEEPGFVKWSIDYGGYVEGNRRYNTENIASCDHCYAGDPRYTRVVVVEEFCIPEERLGCVQLEFTTDRALGDGAGFVGLVGGEKFVEYTGARETIAKLPGKCVHHCPENDLMVDIVMFFDEDFPSELNGGGRSPIWSSDNSPLPGPGGPVLVQACIPSNTTSPLWLRRSGSQSEPGRFDVYVDSSLVARQGWDIGAEQRIDIMSMQSSTVFENIESRCDGGICDACAICPEGMVANAAKTVNVGVSEAIFCTHLEQLGLQGEIRPEFCSLYPESIASLCGCRVAECRIDQAEMRIRIEFDSNPSDISFEVTDEIGDIVWEQDFVEYENNEEEWALKEFVIGSCVPKDGPLHFAIKDKAGDGLCCTTKSYGSPIITDKDHGYEVRLDDVLVGKRLFAYGDSQKMVFRSGQDSSPVLVEQQYFCHTSGCSLCLVNGGSYNPSDVITLEIEGQINCGRYISSFATYASKQFCDKHRDHIASSCGFSSFNVQCAEGEAILSFRVDVESYPQNIAVKVMDRFNATIRRKEGFQHDNGNAGTFEVCVSTTEPLNVQVYDSAIWGPINTSDGSVPFDLSLNGELVASQVFSGNTLEFLLGSEFASNPTAYTVAVAPPSAAPVVALEPQNNPPCSICGEGMEVTIPDTILTIPGRTETPTCLEFEYVGRIGWIPASDCGLVAFVVSEPCGCAPIDASSRVVVFGRSKGTDDGTARPVTKGGKNMFD